MELMSMIGGIVGPVATRILQDVWQDWRAGRKLRQGMAVSAQGDRQAIPSESGVLNISETESPQLPLEEPPILVTGAFVADESFAGDVDELTSDDGDARIVLVILDQGSESDNGPESVYFCQFDFDGYAISLWPGTYSFYAFIIHPASDQIFGIGYPVSNGFGDPNPITIDGEGTFAMDFYILDPNEYQ